MVPQALSEGMVAPSILCPSFTTLAPSQTILPVDEGIIIASATEKKNTIYQRVSTSSFVPYLLPFPNAHPKGESPPFP
jgi:hypothetical protein